jgi:regulator of protease activity HflC (stomatin/prohibitin superfamily)
MTRPAPGLALFDAQQAAERAREATKARDAAILAARADGESVAVIAEAVGMTGPGVRRVLARYSS